MKRAIAAALFFFTTPLFAGSQVTAKNAALAREGTRVDAGLATALTNAKELKNADAFRAAGRTLAIDAKLVQPDLASSLSRIATFGAADFYDGAMADSMVTTVRNGGGAIGYRDLREYTATWRAPIKIRFRDLDIYVPAPPSGGGLMIAEALNILGTYDLAASGFQSVMSLHLIAEAERRASIDRDKYAGDPTNARIPYRDLLSAERATAWRASIKADKVTPTVTLVEPGTTPA